MTILMITNPAHPPLYNERVRCMAQHLSANGWFVDIVGENITDTKGIRWLMDKFLHTAEHQIVRDVLRSRKHYDLILVSTFSWFGLRAAHTLAQRLHIPYVVDLRDIAEQFGLDYYYRHHLPNIFANAYRRYEIRVRNRILQHAQAVTTVSQWHVNTLKRYNANTHLILNGYTLSETEPLPNDHFTLAYFGRFMNLQFRDPSVLFKALQNIPEIPVELRFYCEPELQDTLRQQYSAVQVLPFLSREETYAEMRRSAIVLVFSNKRAQGLMGTKVYEAIGLERPILLSPRDKDGIADLLDQTHAGLASDSIEEIQAFILDKYREWEQNRCTHQAVCNKERFDRQYQCLLWEKILIHTIEKQTAHSPQVSIIVPVYNVASDLLQRCICSVQQQTYKNIQLIVVDDGSDTPVPNAVRIPHSGQGKARNIAIQNYATGEYVLFLDADDYLEPDCVEQAINAIGNKDVLQFGHYRFYQQTAPWSRLYKKQILPPFEEGVYYEDVYFSMRLWQRRPTLARSKYNGYHYSVHPNSTTASAHPSDKQSVLRFLLTQKDRRLLALYTYCRLKLHFYKTNNK